MGDHAKYSPSKLKRIIACPGSVKLSEGIEETTSPYAEEGTMLHGVMEYSVASSLDHGSEEMVLHIPPKAELDKEQMRACEASLDYLNDLLRDLRLACPEIAVYTEKKVSLAKFKLDDCGGTADIVISASSTGGSRVIHVIDWKFGQGVFVPVKDNPQLKSYGLGALVAPTVACKYDKVFTHVVQPRLNNFASAEYTPKELMEWASFVVGPALISAELGGSFEPGEEQCKWCLAKGICRARYEVAEATAKKVFAAYAVDADKVTDAEVKWLLDDAKVLEGYVKDLKARALGMGLRGENFPGHKVVLGRGSRVWKNPKKAEQPLIEKADQGDFEFDELFTSKTHT